MEARICQSCGGNSFSQKNGDWVCDYCQAHYVENKELLLAKTRLNQIKSEAEFSKKGIRNQSRFFVMLSFLFLIVFFILIITSRFSAKDSYPEKSYEVSISSLESSGSQSESESTEVSSSEITSSYNSNEGEGITHITRLSGWTRSIWESLSEPTNISKILSQVSAPNKKKVSSSQNIGQLFWTTWDEQDITVEIKLTYELSTGNITAKNIMGAQRFQFENYDPLEYIENTGWTRDDFENLSLATQIMNDDSTMDIEFDKDVKSVEGGENISELIKRIPTPPDSAYSADIDADRHHVYAWKSKADGQHPVTVILYVDKATGKIYDKHISEN